MSAQGTGNHPQGLLLSPQSSQARAVRVLQLKALVEAGLYVVDGAALARAILRRGWGAPGARGAPYARHARALDSQPCA